MSLASSDHEDMTASPDGLVTTRHLVVDYIAYRLGKHGLSVPGDLSRSNPDGDDDDRRTGFEGKLERALRDLGDEFQRRYSDVYSDMCESLAVNPSNAEKTFNAIVAQLFDGDTINWGRIVALFTFTGALATFCVKKDMDPVVGQFVSWTTCYIDDHLLQWININGGWNGLLDFYQNREDNQNGEWSWPCVSSLCGYVFSAVGMVTLSAVLSRK